MSILKLPVELLEGIASYIFADDLNSLCQSCRQFYSAVRQRLPEHRALQDQFAHFNMETSPIEMVFQTIKFGKLRASIWEDTYRAGNTKQYRDLLKFVHEFESFLSPEFVEASKKFLLANEDDEDIERAAASINIFASTVLVSLMPNLKEAEMPDIWDRLHLEIEPPYPQEPYRRPNAPQALWDMFDAMSAMINSFKTPSSLQSSGLKKITCASSNQERWRRTDCEMIDFRHFLEIQSLEELQVTSVVELNTAAHEKIPTFHWRPTSLPSSLRVLEFKHCFLRLADLAIVLQSTPHLTVLRHSATDREYCKFQANTFIQTVARSVVGPKLRELSLQTSEEGDGWGYETIQSFGGLNALKILEVHCDFLWHGDLGPWSTDCDFNEVRQKHHSWISFCPRLVDLIPASVERLTLHSLWLERDSDTFVRYFLENSWPAGKERKDFKDIDFTFCPNMNGTLNPEQFAKPEDREVCYKSLRDIGVNVMPVVMGPILGSYSSSDTSEEDN